MVTRRRLFVPNTQFNLDLSDHGSATPGTHVVVWTKWSPGKCQTWRFEEGEPFTSSASRSSVRGHLCHACTDLRYPLLSVV